MGYKTTDGLMRHLRNNSVTISCVKKIRLDLAFLLRDMHNIY